MCQEEFEKKVKKIDEFPGEQVIIRLSTAFPQESVFFSKTGGSWRYPVIAIYPVLVYG
ncbi:MAG: hypothetical protein LBS37_10020 [Treponema sp.]|jgi:hypothetical protein|nr:hypothetical protein [Treponema sp.]